MARRDYLRARRNAAILTGTGAVLALLMLYPTSTNSATQPRRPGQALAAAGVVTTRPAAAAAPVPTLTINGRSTDTKYGPVQVQITVRGGQLLSATAIDYPQTGGRDVQINTYAIPVLQQETLLAHSARIDTVSGATYTSAGYRTSLQSALDLAHLN